MTVNEYVCIDCEQPYENQDTLDRHRQTMHLPSMLYKVDDIVRDDSPMHASVSQEPKRDYRKLSLIALIASLVTAIILLWPTFFTLLSR